MQLAKKVNPSAVVGLQKKDELNLIINELDDINIFLIDSPHSIQSRNREKRRLLRELSYKKYMKNAKVQSFSLNWVKVEDSILGSGYPINHKRMEILCNLLGKRPFYSEEAFDSLLVVLKKNESINENRIRYVEAYFKKSVKVLRMGDEEGLLVGLKDSKDHFLGIGVLNEVDYKRKTLKIYSPVSQKVSVICFGKIKLNKDLREIGLSSVYSKTQ